MLNVPLCVVSFGEEKLRVESTMAQQLLKLAKIYLARRQKAWAVKAARPHNSFCSRGIVNDIKSRCHPSPCWQETSLFVPPHQEVEG